MKEMYNAQSMHKSSIISILNSDIVSNIIDDVYTQSCRGYFTVLLIVRMKQMLSMFIIIKSLLSHTLRIKDIK